MNEKLAEAVAKIKAGDKTGAQRLIAEILKNDPQNDDAWLYMSAVAPEERRRDCIQRALSINPNNRQAQLALARLDAAPGGPKPASTSIAAPQPRPTSPPPQSTGQRSIPPPPVIPPAPIIPRLDVPARPRPSLTPQSPEEIAIPPAPSASTFAQDEPEIEANRPLAWIDPRKNSAMLVFLDDHELVTCPVLMGQVKKIQNGLKEGTPPKELLPDSTVIPLDGIQEVSELSGSITVTYTKDAKPRKERFSFRENSVADTVMENLEKRLGSSFQRGSKPMGAGSRIIVILVLLAILASCVGFFYWGALEYENGLVSPTGSARTRGIIALVGMLGTKGVLIIGGVLLLLLVLYALSMFLKPPQITILTRTGEPATR